MSKIIIYIYNIIPSILKNRYVLSTIFFLIWISFFDTNSLSTQLKQKQEIQQLKQDIMYFGDKYPELVWSNEQKNFSTLAKKYSKPIGVLNLIKHFKNC